MELQQNVVFGAWNFFSKSSAEGAQPIVPCFRRRLRRLDVLHKTNPSRIILNPPLKSIRKFFEDILSTLCLKKGEHNIFGNNSVKS